MGDLITFPQRRNVGKARHVAALWMQRRPGRERDAYWTNVCKRYREVMERLGFSSDIIDRELRGFTAAVEEQILVFEERAERHVLDRAADFVEAHRMLDELMSEKSDEIRGQRDVTHRHVTPTSPDNSPGAA